jgi:hypothetical protein
MDAQPIVDDVEPIEEWRAIAGFPGYSVSNVGRVRNEQSGRILLQTLHRGHYRVGLMNHGRQIHCFVHRLVVQAFVGPIPEGLEVDHIDRNGTNNIVSNLRIVSKSENCRNKVSYRNRAVEYVNDLPDGFEPFTEYRGRPLAAGYYHRNHEYFVRVADQYRRLTQTRNTRCWQVRVQTADGDGLHVYWT